MKPLSKKQRLMMEIMEGGFTMTYTHTPLHIRASDGETYYLHRSVFRRLKNDDYIRNLGDTDCWYITQSGLTALAKPTRNRGKKKKPVIENAHEKIMV